MTGNNARDTDDLPASAASAEVSFRTVDYPASRQYLIERAKTGGAHHGVIGGF
jgi:hypothetical protein